MSRVTARPRKNKDFDLFHEELSQFDPEIFSAIEKELSREQNQIELIASENIVSRAVLEAQGSVLTNKYAEGYPGRRYYGGCEFVDAAESLAIERARALFNCSYVNVQPHSGSQANQAVLLAFLKPGDTILGMSLDAGGHLTHGSRVNLSGKWFNIVAYGLEKSTGRIDYAQLEERALKEKPKLIIAGGSAYPRNIDFKKFREVADKVGAYLMVDMAHFAGLVAGGVSPNPLPYAHMVTTTTHKTMRGPRGGMILSVDDEIGKKINSAVFPGLQGGPLMHIIAAKAVAFKEALQPNFKIYVQQIIKNAKALSESLLQQGFNLVSGGTDTHLLLVDLHNKGVTGKDAEAILERAFLTCNKNSVPMDEQPPTITSGIRLGTPAGTTRGFGEDEFRQVGEWIGTLIHAYKDNPEAIEDVIVPIRKEVQALCGAYPIYDFQGKGGTSK